MPQRLERRTRRTFAWIAIIPVLLAGIAFWSRLEYGNRVQWVAHTREVLTTISNIALEVMRAETGQRGYVLTGDEAYLLPFKTAAPLLPKHIQHLRELTRDNPAQIQNLQRLDALIQAKLDELRATIALRRSKGEEAALVVIRTNQGRELTAAISSITSQMTATEEALLAKRERERSWVDWQVTGVFVTGIVATILLLLWASVMLKRYSNARDTAELAVRTLNRDLKARTLALDTLNHELEERVANRTESLKRSNDDLQQFAYVASHDLQEPLRMIGSYVGLLARRYRGKLDDDADMFIHYAVDGAKRMQSLINDLLQYSRVGTQELAKVSVQSRDIVKQVLNDLLAATTEAQAEIEIGDLPQVQADPTKLSLVFQNLISNAIRFRKPDIPPRIRIWAERNESEWCFAVQDNGIGFDPKYAAKIFIIFQRLHGVGQYPGTGMGLSIAKRIVEGHGGRIWVESQPEAGSTFFFTVPDVGENSLTKVTESYARNTHSAS